MWIIIIMIAVGVIIACYRTYNSWYASDFSDYLINVPFGIVLGFMAGLIVAAIIPAKVDIEKTTYQLQALKDNTGTSGGSLFLGTGYIDGKMKYVFYYEDDVFYRLKEIEAKNVRVKYSEGNPKAESFARVLKKGVFLNNFSLIFNENMQWVLYVPEGSIKQSYILDAE